MISCKGCPFLVTYMVSVHVLSKDKCTLNYETKDFTSKDCKLEVVTYALKGVSDSIDFIPKEINGKS